MQTINCEITKVFDRNDKTIGFALNPLNPNEDTKTFCKKFTRWNDQYKNCPTNMFHNNKPNPDWVVEGAQISCDWTNNEGWLNIDKASVEVIKLPDDAAEKAFNAEIDAIAEEDQQERIAEQLEKEAEKDLQNNVKKIEVVKSNNPFETKATDMEMAYMACRHKEFFKFFVRDLDALQKLVVTVFLSNT